MLIHAPEALRLRTTRSWWSCLLPRPPRGAALYALVCAVSLAAAALFVFVLLQDDGAALQGPLAAQTSDSRPRTTP